MEKQKYTSACTSINAKKAPAVYGMKKAIDIMSGKTVIDIGGGKYDIAIETAKNYGATVEIYDKFNRTESHNNSVLSGDYDVAIISNVLNVIDSKDARADVILLAAQKASTILVTVYEGNGTGIGKQSGIDSWQENRKTADYVQEIQQVLPMANIKRHGKLIVCNL